MVLVGFCGKFGQAVASLHHICKHKEVVPAISHVRMLQVADFLLAAVGIIQLIIFMVDCNPERILCL